MGCRSTSMASVDLGCLETAWAHIRLTLVYHIRCIRSHTLVSVEEELDRTDRDLLEADVDYSHHYLVSPLQMGWGYLVD